MVDLSKPANLVHHEGVEEEHEHSEEASDGATDAASAVATAQSTEPATTITGMPSTATPRAARITTATSTRTSGSTLSA